MKLFEDTDKKKRLGVYYTPAELASGIVNRILPDLSNASILEPSCGDGVFLKSILNKYPSIGRRITAVEISDESIAKAKQIDGNINFLNLDFFEFYKKNELKFDIVIGNPPYIRYQYLTKDQRDEMAEILSSHGMKPNKLINAWVAFTVACSALLSEKGTIVFVIPAELLQVDYAKDLRKYLTETFEEISVFAFKKLVFEDIEQETVIFFGRKKANNKGIRVIQCDDVQDFLSINFDEIAFHDLKKSDSKWTEYFTGDSSQSLIEEIKSDNRFKRIEGIATINVGVTTGSNDFFSIDKNVMDQYGLSDYCVPLIGKSCLVKSLFFTAKDIESNNKRGKKAHLLVLKDDTVIKQGSKLDAYLKLGVANNINKGYKCSIRKHWYCVPSVWMPDAFMSRRNGEYTKLLWNSCNATSTDTMHRIKFNEGIDGKNFLFAFYNSVTIAFTELCGRSYGGGVLEILPGEARNIYIPDIRFESEQVRDEYLKSLDKMIREGKSIEDILDFTDKIILIDMLHFSRKKCMQYRRIWQHLQQRRLARGKNKKEKGAVKK